ncbi:hypothetical protein StoSoilB22_30730 [Arthrobacter sp. StoSoilB22]|nr:hypothetical protein StoSoilB22_30730 [Arthrobacter sp. StoSoilB22]
MVPTPINAMIQMGVVLRVPAAMMAPKPNNTAHSTPKSAAVLSPLLCLCTVDLVTFLGCGRGSVRINADGGRRVPLSAYVAGPATQGKRPRNPAELASQRKGATRRGPDAKA